MTLSNSRPDDEATRRAALLIAQALIELQNGSSASQELASSRAVLQDLAQRMELQLAEDREQRLALAGQLTNLAGSLDRLVGHLQGLSQLMGDLLERLAQPGPIAPVATLAAIPEPTFRAGGEGVSVTITGVPGFQALMDIQKALIALDQVDSASVERFQEGDSRILLQLRGPLAAEAIAGALRAATGRAFVIEESQPALMRLRLKLVNGA